MGTLNNLPSQPYKKFFGRKDAISKINNTLLQGSTFIASIDGIGGIGKTALAYHFCQEYLISNNDFNYLVWITSKNTVFDPFSRDLPIKKVDNQFKGIETLIDNTLSVMKFEELIDKPLDEKKEFYEEEIIKGESIFYILDNLENINDEVFFKYITENFNKFAVTNRKLKILTTSRKRKKLVDFPIEIEGLNVESALEMLKYLANEYNIEDIINANDHDNIKLIEKVGRIPLGIEFIIGQMKLGKNRGKIFEELEGYKSVDNINDEDEKKKRLSEIILFSFKDMYETLDDKHQFVFQVIASLEKNKRKNDTNISLELLMSITDFSSSDLGRILDTLTENKLINIDDNGYYTINQMAINFVRQHYENFEKTEDEVIGKRNKILKGEFKSDDKVEILLNNVRNLIEQNNYEKAEEQLTNALDISQDYRIYFELAKIQRVLNKFNKSADNFKMATELYPNDTKIWFEWINLEDNRARYHIALDLSERALEKTNYDVSILIQKINLLKYKKEFETLRKTVLQFLLFYEYDKRMEDYIRLLRNWKNIEHKLLNENLNNCYFDAIEKLIEKESDLEIKFQLLHEELNISKKLKMPQKTIKIKKEIDNISGRITKSINERTKKLNKLFNARKYEEAKSEARKILNWTKNDEKNIDCTKNALRVLLHILAKEEDYDRIIMTFDDFKEVGYKDDNCIDIYESAKKKKNQAEKDEIIKKIMLNISASESIIRDIIMKALNYEEIELQSILKEKDKIEWFEQWQNTKAKSLAKDAFLIYYSDLSQLRSILCWTKKNILELSKNISLNFDLRENIKKIVALLEDYICKERNEAFHSRLSLLDISKLQEILVDTTRLKKLVDDLHDKLKNEKNIQ